MDAIHGVWTECSMANDESTNRNGEPPRPLQNTNECKDQSNGALPRSDDRKVTEAINNASPPEPLPPNPGDLTDLPRNDYGNAQRLIAHHGADMIFVDATGWYLWDNRRWEASPDKRAPEAQKRAHLTALAIMNEADALQLGLQSLRGQLKTLKAELADLDERSQQAFELC